MVTCDDIPFDLETETKERHLFSIKVPMQITKCFHDIGTILFPKQNVIDKNKIRDFSEVPE